MDESAVAEPGETGSAAEPVETEPATGAAEPVRHRSDSRAVRLIEAAAEIVLAAVVFAIAATSIIGAKIIYSPVPGWDHWLGAIDFYDKARTDFWGQVWAQHYEHRIVLSKLLFYIDNAYFGGSMSFLIVVNFVLAFLVGLALAWLAWCMFGDSPAARRVLGLVAIGVGLSWMHAENLTFAFQSQFFLTPLFGVVRFVLAVLAKQRGAWWLYALSVLTGMVGAISMGSGLPIPLVLLVLLLVIRAPWKVLVVAAAATGVFMFLYFRGYVSPHYAIAPQGPLVSFWHWGVPFLGGPMRWATGSVGAAQVTGVVFLVVAAALGIFMLIRRPRRLMDWAAMAVVVFAVANAVSSSTFRGIFGAEFATTSRYQIVVASAWFALGLLVVSAFSRGGRSPLAAAWVVALAFVLILVGAQRHSLDGPLSPTLMVTQQPAPRLAAALSVELGTGDLESEVPELYWTRDGWAQITDFARANRLAVFGSELAGLREMVGKPDDRFTTVPCEAQVSITRAVPDRPWSTVHGWTDLPNVAQTPRLVEFRAPDGTVAGFGVAGQQTPDGSPAAAGTAGGISGYVLTAHAQDFTTVCLANP